MDIYYEILGIIGIIGYIGCLIAFAVHKWGRND